MNKKFAYAAVVVAIGIIAVLIYDPYPKKINIEYKGNLPQGMDCAP